MGDTADRQGRWAHLHRHIYFGQGHDWHDIHEMDWLSVKNDIEAAGFSRRTRSPSRKALILGSLRRASPRCRLSTALNWAVLDPNDFEHLVYHLVRLLPGYQNVQLLMKTNAADRGRDISAERVIKDGAGLVRTERVIIQAKHWLSRSVPPIEIERAVTHMELWGTPVVRGLVIATSGSFTTDAVAVHEIHNDKGKQPYIDLWSETRLSTLLSERPHLVAEYGLR